MIPVAVLKNITTGKAELTILKTIAYFDIFDYPLSEKEIKNFLSCSVYDAEFRSAMHQLVLDMIIFKVGEFYSLKNGYQQAEKRLQGNCRAEKLLLKAAKVGAFLHKFPYVRAVAVSGSLSKGYADEKADIDFFIITKANRLWIARTILHLFKKIAFLSSKQHLYCMNYFIDENALTIQEENIYTATEIVTLFPVSGSSVTNKFFAMNKWVEEWLPDYKPARNLEISEKGSFFKKLTEWFFNKGAGDRLDNFLFTWTTRRWKQKEKRGQKNSKGRVMNLITGKHFSKSNPEAFQEKIVELYETNVEELKNRWLQM
jgi:predicted nucleotidyltransferase